jgi:hypothetical protein
MARLIASSSETVKAASSGDDVLPLPITRQTVTYQATHQATEARS